MQTSENTIPEIAASLKQSPLFHISQNKNGSVEDLQSSFLAWLAEEYPETVALWLREVLGVFTETIVRVKRNAHGFDLLLFLDFEDNGHVVVVKHNMASISNPDELQHIVDKAREIYGDRAQFLLFSLSDIAPFLPIHHSWTVCGYDYYAETLQTVRTRRYRNSDHYHTTLLSDYVFTIKQYSRIHTIATNISNDEPLLGSLTQFEPLKDSRFDMFAVKVRYEHVLKTICERLSISLHSALSSNQQSKGDIRVYSGVRGSSRKPLVGLECVIRAVDGDGKEPMNLGMQVEGNQFRLYVSMPRGGENLEQFAKTLRAENRWFTFQEKPELQALERLWSEDSQTKDFCGYSQNGIKNFVYCYKPFAEAVSADEIINAVVAYMLYVRKSFVAK